MATIRQLTAMEILDSRGRPTVRTSCELEHGVTASASVPSGASTGSAEALELRDGDPSRYRGLGCRQAVANVNGSIALNVRDRKFETPAEFDQVLIECDGTANKSRLGANAILSASLAFARALALAKGEPLYEFLADLGPGPGPEPTLPRLTINLFSGGKHAGGQVPIQDVLIVPASARTIDEGLAMAYGVYQAAVDLTKHKYGMRPLTADEGGLAPPFPDVDAMLGDAVESIRVAGLKPGTDVALAVDVASTQFYRDGRYVLGQDSLDSAGMIGRIMHWIDRFPIVSVEDGLAEDDWEHWPRLRAAVGSRALVLGDDLLCTNPERIRRAIDAGAANALLLKVNQIGTLTEAAESLKLARGAGWRVTVSARSGETEDDWLADLAVAWGDQIKVGSITQSERLAKYNRLLEIEAETGWPVVGWPRSQL
jgi:enolase